MNHFLDAIKYMLGIAKTKANDNAKRRNEPKYYATKKLRQKGIKIDTQSKVIYTATEPTCYVKKWCKILHSFGYVQQTILGL